MTFFFEIITFLISLILISSAFSVVTTKNTVHAVFFLIFTFSLSSLLLLLIDVEFIALLFVVVYVGAIAVLFLFVVMMLDLREVASEQKDELIYLDTSIIIAALVLMSFSLYIFEPFILTQSFAYNNNTYYLQYVNLLNDYSNISLIGDALYTFFSPVFILAGYLLLLAMLGSIMLTLKQHIGSRKQFSFYQQERQVRKSVLKFNVKA